jgi:hypothetical protein
VDELRVEGDVEAGLYVREDLGFGDVVARVDDVEDLGVEGLVGLDGRPEDALAAAASVTISYISMPYG